MLHRLMLNASTTQPLSSATPMHAGVSRVFGRHLAFSTSAPLRPTCLPADLRREESRTSSAPTAEPFTDLELTTETALATGLPVDSADEPWA
jgi:hypothetical protein